MLKKIVLVIVSSLITLQTPILLAQNSHQTYYVSPNGHNSNPGTKENPWASPGFASRQLIAGDSLIILGGNYVLSQFDADIIVPASGTDNAWITITGERGNRPILAGKDNLMCAIILNGKSYIRLENLEITNNDGAFFRDGISGIGALSSHIIFRDLYIHHIDEFGIDFSDFQHSQILNCNVSYCGFGSVGGPRGEFGGWKNIEIRDCNLSYNGHYYQGGNGPGPYDRPDGFGIEPSTGPIEIVNTVAEHNRGDGLDSKADSTYIHDCIVANNSCDGIKLWGTGSKIKNCLIYGRGDGNTLETPWAAIVISTERANSHFEIINTTVDDSLGHNYVMYVQYDNPSTPTDLVVRNTIFSSRGENASIFLAQSVNFIYEYNLFYFPNSYRVLIHNGTDYFAENVSAIGTGNVYGNPRFVATAFGTSGDYHLTAESPAIATGNTEFAPMYDLAGNARLNDGMCDIGCYESQLLTVTPTSLNFGSDQTSLDLTVKNEGTGVLDWSIQEESLPGWISLIQPNQGRLGNAESQPVSVSVDRTDLVPGSYNSSIHFNSNCGIQSTSVTLDVVSPLHLEISTDTLNFGVYAEQLGFIMQNTGDQELSWRIDENTSQTWITGIAPGSGQLAANQSQIVNITVDRSKLTTDHATGAIEINAQGILNPAGTIIIEVQRQESLAQVERFRTLEIELPASQQYDNAYVDVILTAQLQAPGGQGIQVTGYWYDENTWKLRLMPTIIGEWSFTTSSNDPNLDNISGTFQCVTSNHPGILMVNPDRPYSFMLSNDGPFFWMGETGWCMMSDAVSFADGTFQEYVNRRKQQKFNNIHFVLGTGGLPVGTDNPKNEGGYLWHSQQEQQINADFFKWVDKRMAYLDSLQLAVGIFFTWSQHFSTFSRADFERLEKYLIARYGAYPLIYWVIVGEFDESGKITDYKYHGNVIYSNDPYGHLISNHPDHSDPANIGTSRIFANESWFDFIIQQLPHYPGHVSTADINGYILTDRVYHKPVVNIEFGYEEMSYDGRVFTSDDVRKCAWAVTMGGGFPSYGHKETIRAVNLNSINDPGAGYMTCLFNFFRNLNWWEMQPDNQKVDHGFCLSRSNSEYVIYLPDGGNVSVDLTASSGAFQAQWYNPRNGNYQDDKTASGGRSNTYQAPYQGDAVLHLIKSDAPIITVDKDTVTFSVETGTSNILSQEITITNAGGGQLNWSATELNDHAWLNLENASGVSGDKLLIRVDISGLQTGENQGTVRINATGAMNTPLDVPVELNIFSNQPELFLSPTTLDFGAVKNKLTFDITNSGAGNLEWSTIENPEQTWIISIIPANGLLAKDESQQITVSVLRTGLNDGSYVGKLRINSNAGEVDVTVNISKVSQSYYVQRINCGGLVNYIDIDGNKWNADQEYAAGDFGFTGGNTYETNDPIANTGNDPLYQTERWGIFSYRFDVPNGVYQVILHFAEIYCTANYQRLMDVLIEGDKVLSRMDIYRIAGHDVAISYQYQNINVTDGRLDITFSKIREQPKISAIEVISVNPDPILSVTIDTLDFGTTESSLSFTVQNSGSGILDWNITEQPDSPWLISIYPGNGQLSANGQQNINVTIDRSLMEKGNYTGTILLTSNSGSKEIPLLMTVTAPPILDVAPTTLTFDSSRQSCEFLITNKGDGILEWSLNEQPDQLWITSIQPAIGSLSASAEKKIEVTIDRSGLQAAAYSGNINVVSNGGTVEIDVQMVVTKKAEPPTPPPDTTIVTYEKRINCGGEAYTDSGEIEWLGDKLYAAGSYGYVEGNTYVTNDEISGTNNDLLYQSERWGVKAYRFDVPNGIYRVVLHFAEIFCTRSKQRLMNVDIEGNRVLKNLDIYNLVGHDAALSYTFNNIAISDGSVDIEFGKVREQTKISAIEVYQTFSKPLLSVDRDTLNFRASNNELIFTIRNSGSESLNWSATENPDQSWLTQIIPSEGVLTSGKSQNVAVKISRAGLEQGNYAAFINITSNGGAETVYVNMVVPGPSTLSVSDDTLNFGLTKTEMSFYVSNTGGGELTWSASEDTDIPWISSVVPTEGTLNTGQSQKVTVTINKNGMDEGNYQGQVRVTSNSSNHVLIIIMKIEPTPDYAQWINCGSKSSFTDEGGHIWVADQAFRANSFGYVSGDTYQVNREISNTNNDPLYRTERWGMSAYRFTVPYVGRYQVNLHFAEIYVSQQRKRLFDVTIENNLLLDNFDIYAEVGRDVALIKSYEVDVTDGILDITFDQIVENPKISAIEVKSIAGTRSFGIAGQLFENLEKNEAPTQFSLSAAYPNPFNLNTQFQLSIPEDGYLRAVIYNVWGQKVTILKKEFINAGKHHLLWNGRNQRGTIVSNGIYILRVTFIGQKGQRGTNMRRVVLLK